MVNMEVAQVPRIDAPEAVDPEFAVEIVWLALEARCDQLDAILEETRERCREGREKLAAYRDGSRKVSTRWR
jgi:hypothetical protein